MELVPYNSSTLNARKRSQLAVVLENQLGITRNDLARYLGIHRPELQVFLRGGQLSHTAKQRWKLLLDVRSELATRFENPQQCRYWAISRVARPGLSDQPLTFSEVITNCCYNVLEAIERKLAVRCGLGWLKSAEMVRPVTLTLEAERRLAAEGLLIDAMQQAPQIPGSTWTKLLVWLSDSKPSVLRLAHDIGLDVWEAIPALYKQGLICLSYDSPDYNPPDLENIELFAVGITVQLTKEGKLLGAAAERFSYGPYIGEGSKYMSGMGVAGRRSNITGATIN